MDIVCDFQGLSHGISDFLVYALYQVNTRQMYIVIGTRHDDVYIHQAYSTSNLQYIQEFFSKFFLDDCLFRKFGLMPDRCRRQKSFHNLYHGIFIFTASFLHRGGDNFPTPRSKQGISYSRQSQGSRVTKIQSNKQTSTIRNGRNINGLRT